MPCPPPGHLPNPGIKPMSLALAGGFFTNEPLGESFADNSDPQLGHYSPRGSLAVSGDTSGDRVAGGWNPGMLMNKLQCTPPPPSTMPQSSGPNSNSIEVGQSSPRTKPAGCPRPWLTVIWPQLCTCSSDVASYNWKHRFSHSSLEWVPSSSFPSPLPCCLLCFSCPLPWCAAVHVVTKNWTQLSDWTELNWLSFPHTCSLHQLCLQHPLRFTASCLLAWGGIWHSSSPAHMQVLRPFLLSHMLCTKHFCFLCTMLQLNCEIFLWWDYASHRPSVSLIRGI